MKLLCVVFVAVLLSVLNACVSEADRYSWSIAHVKICPSAHALTKQDIADVIRAVTHASTQEPIYIAIDRPGGSLNKLYVGTAAPGALGIENPERTSFGFCTVQRSGTSWKVVEKYTDLDPILVNLNCH